MTPGKTSSDGGKNAPTLAELAVLVDGAVQGDGTTPVTGVAGLKEAGPNDISLFSSGRYRNDLASTAAAAVIVDEAIDVAGHNLLRVANPQLAFVRVLEFFYPPRRPHPGIHPLANVEEGASVDPTASIGPFCQIGGGAAIGAGSVLMARCTVGEEAAVGENTLLHPSVVLAPGVRIGDRVIIQSGAVIGSDGFGYVMDKGRYRKIPQVGTVDVGDDVEIGANVAVDRSTLGTTRIGRGTKIDNLAQIAHNVEIGEDSVIAGQSGIAGSSVIGRRCVFAGQVGVADHITVGDGARIGAKSAVISDVPAGETMTGIGPIPHTLWLRSQSIFAKLPELLLRLRKAERKVAELEKRLAER